MKQKVIKISLVLLLVGFLALRFGVKAAAAAPHFTLDPTSKSVENGSSFSVVVGAVSDPEKVLGMDVVGTFDATKLELVSVQPLVSPAFNFDTSSLQPHIYNDTGKFDMMLAPVSSSVYEGKVVSGGLVTLNFKAKSVGTASVALTCTAGALTETNMMNATNVDVVDCSSNQSGSYTITASSTTAAVPTSVPAATTTTTTTTSTELPRTGSVGSTMGLIVFGLVSVIGACFLKFL